MNQPDNNVINELRELSPAVAAIPRVNVFKVPEGYFDSLATLLLLDISNSENDTIKNAAVPEGYFDSLSSNIMARIKAENTAQTDESSALIDGIGNKNVYTVPAGYFEELSSTIMNRIKEKGSSDVITETNNISELVAGIGNKNVFTVPAGYFEDLSGQISATLRNTAKVVQMNSTRKFIKYAAAAAVTGLIAISTIFIINKNESGGVVTASTNAVMDSAKAIIKTNSFDKEMAGLNDADIVNFLQSKGQDVNAALVASLTEDDKILPEAEDYLINENTLDDVLKNLDLNN
ncbi:MAG: hypothetical protein H7Y86_19390 [Rhizobacter sp.]|nr:hypothetical protein [Ferruginibacter sp.]